MLPVLSLSRAAAPGRGRREGGRGERGGKGRKKSPLLEDGDAAPMSEAHKRLLELFTAIDHAYCFLVKNSIPPRVSSIQVLVRCVGVRGARLLRRKLDELLVFPDRPLSLLTGVGEGFGVNPGYNIPIICPKGKLSKSPASTKVEMQKGKGEKSSHRFGALSRSCYLPPKPLWTMLVTGVTHAVSEYSRVCSRVHE